VTVLGHKYQYIDSKKNEVISNFIDSIYLEIFDTPVGFQMFKDIFHTSVLYEQSIQTKYHEYYYDNFVMLMNHALGIKRKTAIKILGKINSTYVTSQKISTVEPLDSFMILNGNQVLNKKEYILLKPLGDYEEWVESFTNDLNVTTFYIYDDSQNWSYWLKMVAHELAITFDMKNKLYRYLKKTDVPMSHAWLEFLDYSLTNTVFSIVRAWRFESMIYNEMGKKYKLEEDDFLNHFGKNFNEKTCNKAIEHVFTLFQKQYPQDKKAIQQIHQMYVALTDQSTENPKELSCVFLTQPQIAGRFYEHAGPKPRIRGWDLQ